MASEDISIEEVIKYAVMCEKECCVFYRNIAKVMEGGRLFGFFSTLAGEELEHLNLLLDLIDGDRIGENILHSHVTVDTDVFETLINESWNPYGLSEEQILYLAAEREKIVIESYRKIVEIKAAPPELTSTAEKIQNLENDHLRRINEKIRLLYMH